MRPLSASRRRRALALMTDTCTITRTTITRQNGRDVAVEQVVYEGRCKVQTYEAYESNPLSGGHTYTVQRYRLDIPLGAGPIEPGDVAKVNTYRRSFRIAGGLDKTHQSAQRLPVEIITR